MCHGDMTPIINLWDEKDYGYIAQHTTIHSCRNFQAIYDWAAERNDTDLIVDGMHINVGGSGLSEEEFDLLG